MTSVPAVLDGWMPDWVGGETATAGLGRHLYLSVPALSTMSTNDSLGMGGPTCRADAMVAGHTDTPLEDVPLGLCFESPPLHGMRLGVQRAKRLAKRICPGASFLTPVVQSVEDEDAGTQVYVVLRVLLPAEADDFAFRDEYFPALAEELQPAISTRLAIRVLRPA